MSIDGLTRALPRHLSIVTERCEAGAARTGEHVPRGDRVAEKQGIRGRDADRDGARRMPRYRDDLRASGQAQDIAIGDRTQIGDVAGAKPAPPNTRPEEGEGRLETPCVGGDGPSARASAARSIRRSPESPASMRVTPPSVTIACTAMMSSPMRSSFCMMEQNGGFRQGGDVDAAFEEGLRMVLRGIGA